MPEISPAVGTPAAVKPDYPRLAKYSAGGFLDQWGVFGIKNTANQIFNLVLGLNPALIGIIIASVRLWDAFLDPIVGNVSDNLRTRWGCRRPLIIVGGLLCGLLFPLFWFLPVGVSPAFQTTWFIVAAFLFYTGFAIFSIPFRALGYELARGSHDKTRFLATRAVVATLTTLAVSWVFSLIQSGFLGAPRESLQAVSWMLGGLMILSALIPGLMLKEPQSPESLTKKKVPMRTAFRCAVASPPLRNILAASTLSSFFAGAANTLGSYVVIYYVYGGNLKQGAITLGLFGTASVIVSIVSAPLISKLSARLGKWRTLMLMYSMALASTGLKWFVYTPTYPYAQFIIILLQAPSNCGMPMLAESLVADISDYERWKSGHRYAGFFSATFSWLQKTGLAVAVAVSGFLLVATGFEVNKHIQGDATLFWLRLVFTFVPMIGISLGIYFLRRFDLSPKQMCIVAEELRVRDAQKVDA